MKKYFILCLSFFYLNTFAYEFNSGIAMGQCNMDLNLPAPGIYEEIAAPFFYSNPPQISTVTIPPGVTQNDQGKTEFERQCILFFKNVCTIYPFYKKSRFDQKRSFETAVHNPIEDFNQFTNVYAYGLPGFQERYMTLLGFGDNSRLFKNLKCHPMDSPESVRSLQSAPHPNYVYPLDYEQAQALVDFARPSLHYDGVLNPPTPMTGSAFGYELQWNIDEAESLGVLELQAAGAVMLTGVGVSSIVWLAQNGTLLSSAWEGILTAAGTTLGETALMSASRILWPIGAFVLGSSFTSAYNNVLKDPSIFPKIPKEQQNDISRNHPDVFRAVVDYNRDLVRANTQARALQLSDRSQKPLLQLKQTTLTENKAFDYQVYIPKDLPEIQVSLFNNRGQAIRSDKILRTPTGIAHGTLSMTDLENGIYFVVVGGSISPDSPRTIQKVVLAITK